MFSTTPRTLRSAAACGVLALAGTAAISTAPASASTTPRCHTSQLHGRVGAAEHAAGSTYAPIVLRNASGYACHVRGYPGVAFTGGTGDVSTDPVRSSTMDGGSGGAITLYPGQSASATLAFRTCTRRTGPEGAALITPPDEYDHLIVRSSRLAGYCGGRTRIGLLVRGTRGVSMG